MPSTSYSNGDRIRYAHTTNYVRWYYFALFAGRLTNGPLPFPGVRCLQNLCMWPSLPQLQHLMTWFLPLSGGLSLGPIVFPLVPFFWHFFFLLVDPNGSTASILNCLFEWQTSMGSSSYSETSSSRIFHFHSDRTFWYAASNVCGSSFITAFLISLSLSPSIKKKLLRYDLIPPVNPCVRALGQPHHPLHVILYSLRSSLSNLCQFG